MLIVSACLLISLKMCLRRLQITFFNFTKDTSRDLLNKVKLRNSKVYLQLFLVYLSSVYTKMATLPPAETGATV